MQPRQTQPWEPGETFSENNMAKRKKEPKTTPVAAPQETASSAPAAKLAAAKRQTKQPQADVAMVEAVAATELPAPALPATPIKNKPVAASAPAKVMPLAPKLEERRQRDLDEEEEKIGLQQEIRQLLGKRNPGVSLHQFAQALGLDPRLLEELQSYRCNLEAIRFAQLETVLQRIQSLYEEQSAIS